MSADIYNSDCCQLLVSPMLLLITTHRFHNDHSICFHHGGIAFKKDEGTAIAEALGGNKVVILGNHGHLSVGKTVDQATFFFGAFDRCIQAQMLADTAAAARGIKTIKVNEEAADYSRSNYTDEMAYIMFQSAFEDVVRASNGELSFHVRGELPREN